MQKISIHVRLTAEQYAELEAWTKHTGESQATIVRQALHEYFIAHHTRLQLELAAQAS